MSESKKARKKIAKKVKPLDISTEGKFLAVLEEMRDEIKIVAEGHSVLARGIDELKDKMGSIEKRMDGMEIKMGSMEKRMDGMEIKMGSMEKRMDGMEIKMGSIEKRMDGMEIKMSGMENRMDNFESELKGLRKEMNQGFKMVFGYAERIEDEIKDVKKEIEILRKELKSKADVQRLEILEKRVQRIERDYAIIMDKSDKKYKPQ
ncbi:MAG: hypothetical protein M0P97_01750 [Candidatus Moranbacteria bacterium]|jgi:chromosome segregation ATPase|nr:hypothetical protein [Candidatus Moranbacteria bacterium]